MSHITHPNPNTAPLYPPNLPANYSPMGHHAGGPPRHGTMLMPPTGSPARLPLVHSRPHSNIGMEMPYLGAPTSGIPPIMGGGSTVGQMHQLTSVTSASASMGPNTMKRKSDGKQNMVPPMYSHGRPFKRLKAGDRVLPRELREIAPNADLYTELVESEKKLDLLIQRKRVQFDQMLKEKNNFRINRKLRMYVSHTYFEPDEKNPQQRWEMKIEGKLLDPKTGEPVNDPKLKFTSFFRDVVIELDKNLFGPDNHLIDWHRKENLKESDGFSIKRECDERPVDCNIILQVLYDPPRYQVSQQLSDLLGVQIQTHQDVLLSLWQYIKVHTLQDNTDKDVINCNESLKAVFRCDKLSFSNLNTKLGDQLQAPKPLIVNYTISKDGKNFSIYDIDVEMEDLRYKAMQDFLRKVNQHQLEIFNIEQIIVDHIEHINSHKLNREFFMAFHQDPKRFLEEWIISQTRDHKVIVDNDRKAEAARKSTNYDKPWVNDAVSKYKYLKINEKVAEMTKNIGEPSN